MQTRLSQINNIKYAEVGIFSRVSIELKVSIAQMETQYHTIAQNPISRIAKSAKEKIAQMLAIQKI